MPASNPVTADLFDFLSELKQHNNRDWFQANKKRYEKSLKEPLLTLIVDFAPMLASLSPHYRAIPKTVGGSLFRIYRDVRFSKNKDPYKTHAAVQFRHAQAKDVHAPGYYLHLEPGNVFVALGVWRPETSALRNIRTLVNDQGDVWESIVGDDSFQDTYRLEGDSLKRAPRGFDPDHPRVEDLKRKDFIAVARLEQQAALEPDFLPRIAHVWEIGTPFMRALCTAINVPF